MRNRELHDALRAFALETAALLREDQDRGAEIEFDLDEGARRGGPTLYHYRPLTAKFIADRWPRLRALPTCGPACAALGVGASAYLRINGLRGAEAEPALRAMLERLYEDATDLSFPEERFERVYAEVERTLYERSQPATVLAPVHGLVLEVERVDLGGGLALVRGGATDAPDDALWSDSVESSGDGRRDPNVLVTLTREVSPDAEPPLAEARERFRRLVTGLRLWKPGGVALSAVGWRRSGAGVWQPFETEPTGLTRGAPWVLAEGEDARLREFLTAIDRARPTGPVAWALSRFEMGCGRARESEALSDYLLGLRALLDRGAEPASSGLALRVAVLCAEEGQRRGVQRRVELAQALERFVMGDSPDDDYMDAIGPDSPRTLVDEVERHLRALLRDVLCGYLDPDLRALSDELLLEQPPPAVPTPEPHSQPVTPAAASEIESLESTGAEIGVTAVDAGQERTSAEDAWDDAGYSAPV
ncbi:MAG TPA: hypothetical protein VHF90_10545 [Thermoleophilaceae bacterium]|nr:hypothetical protein [Thermoleophilaceae bacterium]